MTRRSYNRAMEPMCRRYRRNPPKPISAAVADGAIPVDRLDYAHMMEIASDKEAPSKALFLVYEHIAGDQDLSAQALKVKKAIASNPACDQDFLFVVLRSHFPQEYLLNPSSYAAALSDPAMADKVFLTPKIVRVFEKHQSDGVDYEDKDAFDNCRLQVLRDVTGKDYSPSQNLTKFLGDKRMDTPAGATYVCFLIATAAKWCKTHRWESPYFWAPMWWTIASGRCVNPKLSAIVDAFQEHLIDDGAEEPPWNPTWTT